MTSNITNKPKLTNGVPNAIFNNTDFGTTDDVKYIKRSGDVMSGSLTLPSLVCNGNITLPTTYSVAPSVSQLGGASAKYVWNQSLASVAYTHTNLTSFTVGQGNYLIIYRLALNNLTANTDNFNFAQASISASNIGLDEDYKTSNMAAQAILSGFNTSLNNCFYYNNVSGSPITLYFNYLCTIATLTLRGYVQVVRIG